MLDKDWNVVYNKWIELTDNIKLEDFYTEFWSIVIKDSEGNVKETITMDESKIERALYNAETNELATEDDIKAPWINKIIERVTYDNMYSHDIYHNIYTFVVVYYYDIDTREQIHDRQYIVPGYSFSYSEPDDSLPEHSCGTDRTDT